MCTSSTTSSSAMRSTRKLHLICDRQVVPCLIFTTPDNGMSSQSMFKMVEGDWPAYKGALHDLRNVIHLNKLELPKLYTLATSVIDYLGVRIVAQSIIPGILHGDQQSRLMYGSVEPGVRLKVGGSSPRPWGTPLGASADGRRAWQANSRMHALLQESATRLLLAERVVPLCPIKAREGVPPEKRAEDAVFRMAVQDEKEEEEEDQNATNISFIGPVEWKGIKGADDRYYLLDLLRLTPRDPNWVGGEKGTGVWAGTEEELGALEDDTSTVLRPEALQTFVRSKVLELRKKHSEEYQASRKRPKADGAAEAKAKEAAEGDDEGDKDSPEDELFQRQYAEAEEALLNSMKVNVNVFLPIEGIEDQAQLAADEEHVRRIARCIWDDLIPGFLEEIKRGGCVPTDGEVLTHNLHQWGINVRYIGRLASLAHEDAANTAAANSRYRMPRYFVELCETEMLARAFKHVVFEIFKDRADLRSSPGSSLATCLNHLFGSPAPSQMGEGGGKPPTPQQQAVPKVHKEARRLRWSVVHR
jgi:protein TIF31